MNPNYARIVNGSLFFAPATLVARNGTLIPHPKRLAYLQAGFKRFVDKPPHFRFGGRPVIIGFYETYDTITAVYK